MKKIRLSTKKELNIFMNPTRQQLLHQLSIAGEPMTPKMLADKLKISASSVQYHLKKLLTLGLVELNHTEVINGITARFYQPTLVTVQIGGLGQKDALSRQREVLLENSISQVYEGYKEQMHKVAEVFGSKESSQLQKWGDLLTGVIHLSPSEGDELMTLIYDFIEEHSKPKAGASPWAYALIAYQATEVDHE